MPSNASEDPTTDSSSSEGELEETRVRGRKRDWAEESDRGGRKMRG